MSAPSIPPVMAPNLEFKRLASRAQIERAAAALETHNIQTHIVQNGAQAKKMVLELLPLGAEVHAGMSVTLEQLGLMDEIDKSGRYNAVRPRVMALDRQTQGDQIRTLRARPAYMVGSVHAVTEDGRVLVASGTGSQLAAYANGAGNVIWVVGAQKIVKDLDEGLRRIEQYSFPLEDARMRKLYSSPTIIGKILIVYRDYPPDRTTMIIVNEELGF
jgi:hypothetical protein